MTTSTIIFRPWPVSDDIPAEVDAATVNELLWNSLEPDPIYLHGPAAELVREFAHQVARQLGTVAYLPADQVAAQAHAAADLVVRSADQHRS